MFARHVWVVRALLIGSIVLSLGCGSMVEATNPTTEAGLTAGIIEFEPVRITGGDGTRSAVSQQNSASWKDESSRV